MFVIQSYGRTAMGWAAQEGYEKVVDVLLKAGVSRDVQDKVTASNSVCPLALIIHIVFVQ